MNRDAPYNKAAHRRNLIKRLDGRSEQSIEFKHANISAAMIDRLDPKMFIVQGAISKRCALFATTYMATIAAPDGL